MEVAIDQKKPESKSRSLLPMPDSPRVTTPRSPHNHPEEDKGLFSSWTSGTDDVDAVTHGQGEVEEGELKAWEQLDKWEIDQDQSRFMRKVT